MLSGTGYSYLKRVLKNASLEKLEEAVDKVHKRTGKNKAAIFFDMASCTLKYGSGYYDYLIFGFYDLTPQQRSTYVTRMINKNLNQYMNSHGKTDANGHKYEDYFNYKDEFDKRFKDYIKRGFIVLKEAEDKQILDFIREKEFVFCKTKYTECGLGCEKIKTSDFKSPEDVLKYVREKDYAVMEELIVQNEAQNKLYPYAVNCLRVITLVDDNKEPNVLYVVQKLGLDKKATDNNGMYGPVDIETGKILFPFHAGFTTTGKIFKKTPYTDVELVGYVIPYVKEAVEMCKKAALEVPEIRFIGWDVAITPDGPALIEGNTFCAHDFWQLPIHTPDKTGMLPKIKSLTKSCPEATRPWNICR